MTYRKLTNLEVELMMNQGCRCEDWNAVEVTEGFAPDHVFDTVFSGEVRMGAFTKDVLLEGGVCRHSGISRAYIASCTIGDDVFIDGVRRCLSGCIIGDRAVIQDVGAVYATGDRPVTIGEDARLTACGTLTDMQVGAGVELCHVEQLHRMELSAWNDVQPSVAGNASRSEPQAETASAPLTAEAAVPVTAAPEPAPAPEPVPAPEPSAEPEPVPVPLPEEPETEWDFMADEEELDEPAAGQVAEDAAVPANDDSAGLQETVSEPDKPSEPEQPFGPEPALEPADESVAEAEPEDKPIAAEEPADEPASGSDGAEDALPQQGSLFEEWNDPSPTPVLADTLQPGYSPLNDLYAGAAPIGQTLQARKVARMQDAIGLNDRFLFTRELFKSNPQLYKECLDRIDACASRKEAEAFVRETYGWKKTQPAAKKFYAIIERRFSENE